MTKMILGKVTMFIAAFMLGLPLVGVALCTILGHVFDMNWQKIKSHFLKPYYYQKTSEKIIFLAAYYSYVLGLDSAMSAKTLIKECLVNKKQVKSIESLFIYYADNYCPKNNKEENLDKKLTEAINIIKDSSEDKLTFFRIIESMFNEQIDNANPTEIDLLKKIANIFNINYSRQYQHYTNYEDKQTNYSYNYKDENNDKSKIKTETKSSYISAEIKQAFKELGFNAANPPTLINLKSEYKKQVRKYHPDILKGQNASDKKLKEAEEKLVKLNKSMDLAKNFLANK